MKTLEVEVTCVRKTEVRTTWLQTTLVQSIRFLFELNIGPVIEYVGVKKPKHKNIKKWFLDKNAKK
jgi:hypothetical protein